MKGYMQILNEQNFHWLYMPTIGCQEDEVTIYDSTLNKKKVYGEVTI